MKLVNIIKPNSKGQVVIPKEIRKELNIGESALLHVFVKGGAIFMKPIKNIVHYMDEEDSYKNVLAKAKGSWAGDDWEDTALKQRKVEVTASKKAKEEIW